MKPNFDSPAKLGKVKNDHFEPVPSFKKKKPSIFKPLRPNDSEIWNATENSEVSERFPERETPNFELLETSESNTFGEFETFMKRPSLKFQNSKQIRKNIKELKKHNFIVNLANSHSLERDRNGWNRDKSEDRDRSRDRMDKRDKDPENFT